MSGRRGEGGLLCSKTTFEQLGTVTSNTCGNVSCHSGRYWFEYRARWDSASVLGHICFSASYFYFLSMIVSSFVLCFTISAVKGVFFHHSANDAGI